LPVNALELTEKVQDGVLKALVPFADKVPSPTESLDVAFGFLDKLLAAQQSFLTGIVEIYAPPAVKVTTPTPTATAKKV
jgi:hypothetical protein